ncbi:MAG: alkaline phosphatase D family protein, partial [Verrucomicrobiota bacterium]
DRVFLGGQVWANPMEDWRVEDGWATCQHRAANRNIHSLTHQITDATKAFDISVRLGQAAEQKPQTSAGFRIGIKTEINEYRSNVFAGGGLKAGIDGGSLFIESSKTKLKTDLQDIRLHLSGKPDGNKVALTLKASSADGEELGSVSSKVASDAVIGNIALVSNFQSPVKQRDDVKGYRFAEWKAGGDAFTVSPDQVFGPILWSMYSLSDSRTDEGFVLKMSALTGPMGEKDNQQVELHIQRDGEWKSLGHADLHTDAWTATFRIANWDEKHDTPYKLVYAEKGTDGKVRNGEWTGTILANPTGRPLRMAALTCQKDYGFPYEPVANNVVKLKPDLVFFSGDQLYESHGGYGIIRDPAPPAILNYLRKFYQFGWAFRDAMRNAPTLCLPDDHDVFQGNIWGMGGKPMLNAEKTGASSKGGYREPARMVNAVHITNCGHHPDPYEDTPVEQDISVYYGDMVYGDVSFAIIADRQWKSSPEEVETGSGRTDHVLDPNFDTKKLDKPGLVLLGERQEEFLEAWGKDWRGHKMKAVLSQTVFSANATHHGSNRQYLKADLDSGAWPQTARNRAISILRESKALHINGDQHLTSLSQYGVEKQRDSNWAFCTPAIAAGYPRSWLPDSVDMPHANRPAHGIPNTGEYLDGFGNKTYVYAVGNPEKGSEKHRYDLAHQKASGFGFITFDTEAKTYYLESFKFLIDATDGKASNQFPGWPVIIHMDENAGDNRIGVGGGGDQASANAISESQTQYIAQYQKQENVPKPEDMLINTDKEPALDKGFV